MRKVNVSSVRTYRQIGGARNQPTKEEIDHVQDQEITGDASEARPDEQVETLFSSRKKMTQTTPKAKMPGRRK